MSVVNAFFQHQLTMKMYHFQTNSYGAHKGADMYLTKYALNFDRFMEAWQGANGKLRNPDVKVEFNTVNDENVNVHLDDMVGFLSKMTLSTDLSNIRDEMVADIQQLKYLLLFK